MTGLTGELQRELLQSPNFHVALPEPTRYIQQLLRGPHRPPSPSPSSLKTCTFLQSSLLSTSSPLVSAVLLCPDTGRLSKLLSDDILSSPASTQLFWSRRPIRRTRRDSLSSKPASSIYGVYLPTETKHAQLQQLICPSNKQRHTAYLSKLRQTLLTPPRLSYLCAFLHH